ncbi:hypothetical protein BFF94_009150 [Burkholderia catarinensis]|nr:hypothetical protein BFF94_009150 [Burkholderia catarinensis]
MTAVQRAFVEMCIADAKYEIISLMSISVVSYSARCYSDLSKDVVMGKYGFCEHQVEVGRGLFPDAAGQPEGSGFDDFYYGIICTALDEWLSGPVMPMDQITFPPDPDFDEANSGISNE